MAKDNTLRDSGIEEGEDSTLRESSFLKCNLISSSPSVNTYNKCKEVSTIW